MSSAVVRRFNLAFGRQDVDAVMALSTDDTVLETTLPKPDGDRLCGHEAGRRYWEEFFRGTLDARFEAEARKRIEARDSEDWPTVALSLAMSLPVWSQDKDFSESGLVVYSTGQLLDTLRQIDAFEAAGPER